MFETFNGLKGYNFNYVAAFPDYKTWLNGCYRKFPSIASVHFFNFTQEGVSSMANNSTDANWRLDNSIEPFKLIHKSPESLIPKFKTARLIDEDRLEKFKKAKMPENCQVFKFTAIGN